MPNKHNLPPQQLSFEPGKDDFGGSAHREIPKEDPATTVHLPPGVVPRAELQPPLFPLEDEDPVRKQIGYPG